MRFKMVSLITGMALVCVAGSVLAADAFIVNNSTTIFTNSTAGGAGSTLTSSLNYNAFGIDLYSGVLTTVTGGSRSWNNVTVAGAVVSNVSKGHPFRGWAGGIDQTTGKYYMVADGNNNAVMFADTLGTSPVYPTTQIEQGYGLVGDVEFLGNNVFMTAGSGNSDSRYLWKLDLAFANAPVTVFDSNDYGKNLTGFAFDGAGNVFLGVNNDKVIMLNSSFVYQSTIVSNLSNVKDVDFFNNELYVCTSNGVEVYSTGGALDRTFGPSNATGLVIAPVPEPSSIFGLLVGGTSLIGLLRRRAR
jgi:hypothetical protein